MVRSSLYYTASPENDGNEELMRKIDQQYLETPFYGVEKMTLWLRDQGYAVNRKRIRRLMRQMGLEVIYPRPKCTGSSPAKAFRKYPYLLKGVKVTRPDQVWSADITYVRMARGWVYLTAIIDWYSRYVVGWEISITLESDFCVSTLKQALSQKRRPAIFNTDQGCQFTSQDFTGVLEQHGIEVSMDGKGRAFDNIFSERLWRTVKVEEVYLRDYQTVAEATYYLDRYFKFYNHKRFHQALDYRTPAQVYNHPVGTPVALRAPFIPTGQKTKTYPPMNTIISV